MRTVRACFTGGAMLAAVLLAAPAAAGCSASTAAVAFGNYNPQSAGTTTGTGTISVTCDSSGSGSVTLSLSTGGAANYASRRMTSGANILNYNLYTTVSLSAPVFGDGSGSTATVNFQGANKTTVTTVYGRIPAGQNVRAGAYTNTIIVSVSF